MKGNPLLRIAIILLFLAAVLWPVFKITRKQAAPEVISSNNESKNSPSPLRVTLLLHAAPSPIHCSISQGSVVLLTESNSIAPGEYRAAVEITKGEDLLISAGWKDDSPHAIRAEVLVHGYQIPLEKSYWSQRSLEDTLPIPESFLP